jgi:hypothetical protein
MTRGGSRTDRSANQGARREVEELVVSLRGGAISEARFVAEMVSLREAFERIVGTHVGGQEQRPCCNGIIEGTRVPDKELSADSAGTFSPNALKKKRGCKDQAHRAAKIGNVLIGSGGGGECWIPVPLAPPLYQMTLRLHSFETAHRGYGRVVFTMTSAPS